MSKAARLRRRRAAAAPPDPSATLQRLRDWHLSSDGTVWDSSALMIDPAEAARSGFDTTSHAGNVGEGCWLCWRYTSEAMLAWQADEPIPPAPRHWAYCRSWWPEAFDGG